MARDLKPIRPVAWRKKPASPNAMTIGLRVLAGLAKAQAALKQLRAQRRHENLLLILNLAAQDQERGYPKWGRAGRISRKLGGLLCERQTKRYLDALAV